MAYNSLIPVATNAPATDVTSIQENFAQIKTLIDVNHGDFASSDVGKHTYVTMPQQTSLPTVSSTEYSLFTASDGTNPQLYLRNNSSGAIDLTKDITFTSAVKATTGWCMLPCGLILKWGSGSISSVDRNGATGTATLISGSGIPTITTLLYPSVSRTGGSNGREVVVGYSSFDESAHTVTAYGWRDFTATTTAYFSYLLIGI